MPQCSLLCITPFQLNTSQTCIYTTIAFFNMNVTTIVYKCIKHYMDSKNLFVKCHTFIIYIWNKNVLNKKIYMDKIQVEDKVPDIFECIKIIC